MTPKQIYGDLAKIAGHVCSNGEMFLTTGRITQEHLSVIQSRLRALMDKISYERAHSDFGSTTPRRRRIRTSETEARERSCLYSESVYGQSTPMTRESLSGAAQMLRAEMEVAAMEQFTITDDRIPLDRPDEV